MILRNVTDEDLPTFFEHQRDSVALRMAAFSSRERDAFLTHWRTNVLRPENATRTIVVGGLVAGYICSWGQDDKRLVAYWIGREHWGKCSGRSDSSSTGVRPPGSTLVDGA